MQYKLKVRMGYFLYANGAWQSSDMFYNIMKPRLSKHVTRRYIDGLFNTCAVNRSRPYTTTDVTQSCNMRVCVDGLPVRNEAFSSNDEIKMINWESYVYELLNARKTMPPVEAAKGFFATDNACTNPRTFVQTFKHTN